MLQVFELEPFLSDLIDSIRSERALASGAAATERQMLTLTLIQPYAAAG
jgi:hypothetical protein